MGVVWTLSIYFVVWWLVFIMILPLGVQSHHDAGIAVPGGGEPGSPVDPKLKRKVFTTSWVSAILTAVIWVVYTFGWIHAPGST